MYPRIIFAGLVQNASAYLPLVLKNIENISTLASDTGFIFVENDSNDATKEILNEWGNDRLNFHLINLDGLNSVAIRTLRLARARNTYVELIKSFEKFHNFDYLIVLDMDDVGSYAIELDRVLNALVFLEESPERAAIFANQRGTYYDMWALRHSKLCPSDVWETVFDFSNKNRCSDEIAFSETFGKQIFSLEESAEPLRVDSAFGGFGIYKINYILNNQNPYIGSKEKIILLEGGLVNFAQWQVCEHVHFHQGIKNQGGQMFIYPTLINGSNPGLNFPHSAFRSMLF